MMPGRARFIAKQQTTQDLANRLTAQLSRPVTDATALKAKYDFTLTFAPAGNTTATVYWCGVLAVPYGTSGGISSISGAPVHMRVLNGSQTVGGVATTYSVGSRIPGVNFSSERRQPA